MEKCDLLNLWREAIKKYGRFVLNANMNGKLELTIELENILVQIVKND